MSQYKKLYFNCLLSMFFILTISSQSNAQETKEKIKVETGVNIRVRNELWNTFEKQATQPVDNPYNFLISRARGFLGFSFKNFTIRTMFQGVNGLNFPEKGTFGIGKGYFDANEEENPLDFHLAEISLAVKDLPFTGFYLKGGRIGMEEGSEVLYGEPKIDWIKKIRLSERLVGNWDWANAGRRYDGGIIGYGNSIFNLNLFGANVLQGGIDFDDGYKRLDRVLVFGGSFTLRKDVILPDTEFRFFNIYYFDNRPPASSKGDLKIDTPGLSIVGVYELGPGEMDLLLWSAFQTGSFGSFNQKAFGFIGEIGYQFVKFFLKPWMRFGVAYASGDNNSSDSDHTTFFNLLPTNHKWYGYMDAVALSNLENYYFQLMLEPHKMISFAIDGHIFRLASNNERWIGGSGAFNNKAFGYISFEPVDKNLGSELDLTMTIKPNKYISFDIGYSHFFGGSGVEVVFNKKKEMDWFYVQGTVNLIWEIYKR